MYAQFLTFQMGPGKRAAAEKMADDFNLLHKGLKGYKNAIYLGNDTTGEYGSLSIWETPEDIKSAAEILQPELEKALQGIADGAPAVHVFEIYEPKS